MQANVWIFIFGFVGNYFWTHYFYTVLGATYSFPSYKLNHVSHLNFSPCLAVAYCAVSHPLWFFSNVFHFCDVFYIVRMRSFEGDAGGRTVDFPSHGRGGGGVGCSLKVLMETGIDSLVFQVPLTTFLLTHSYFLFYHMISNFTIRRLRHAMSGIRSSVVRILIEAVWIFVLSYVTAFMEAITIANVSSPCRLFLGSFVYLLHRN